MYESWPEVLKTVSEESFLASLRDCNATLAIPDATAIRSSYATVTAPLGVVGELLDWVKIFVEIAFIDTGESETLSEAAAKEWQARVDAAAAAKEEAKKNADEAAAKALAEREAAEAEEKAKAERKAAENAKFEAERLEAKREEERLAKEERKKKREEAKAKASAEADSPRKGPQISKEQKEALRAAMINDEPLPEGTEEYARVRMPIEFQEYQSRSELAKKKKEFFP